MDQSPQDIRLHGDESNFLWEDSVTQTNEIQKSFPASNNSNDLTRSLSALELDLAAGISDIRTKVEEEHKKFFELIAQGKIFKTQPSQQFAYNVMRGKGLGTQPVFPPPRPVGDEENYRDLEDVEDNLQSGYKYYKIAPDSDVTNAAAPEELAREIDRRAIEEHSRSEVVFDLKGDEGETNNHYKGEEVLANFGYLKLNETWVDPDSEKEVAQASRGYPVLSPEDLEKARAKDARIMSPVEMEEFYDWFNGYVSDDEGDPRENRMSDKEFRNMVRGTASEGKGDTWAKAVVAPQEKFTDRPRKPRKPKTQSGNEGLPPQIDRDTGSYFSGYGSENSDTASLLLSAAGVDMLKRPEHFNRMDPQSDMKMLAQAYGNPNAFKDDSGWSDTTALPVFNSKAAAKAITWDIPGLTDEQRALGLADMTQRGEAHFEHSQMMARNRDELKTDKIIAFNMLASCMRELYFVKQWLNHNPSNQETHDLVYSIDLETPFKRTERSMISKDDPTPTATADPYIGLNRQDRTYMRLINDIYQDTNNLTLHLQNQVMVWGATKAEIEIKVGEYYFLRERIMAASGMSDGFIKSLIPVGTPRTPRVNF